MEGARARRDMDQGAMDALIADATEILQQQVQDQEQETPP